MLERSPYFKALEWVPRVQSADHAAVEEFARRDGIPGFRGLERDTRGMTEAAVRREYFPVLFVEPMAVNRQAMGFDLASDAMRRDAIERVRQTCSRRCAIGTSEVQRKTHRR